MQAVGHTLGEKPITLYPIHTEALQLALFVQKAQAVAIGKTGCSRYVEGVTPQLFDSTHKLAHRLRRVEGGNV